MKRILLILALIVVVLLSALGGGYYFIVRPRLPEWTVVQMMDQLDQLHTDDLEFGAELTSSQEELFGIFIEMALDYLIYEIIDSRIEGQMAYVTLDIETIDASRLITDNLDIIASNILSNWGNLLLTALGGDVGEAIMQEFINLLTDDALEVSMMTQTVEISLERDGFFWVPILTDELLLSVVGLDDSIIRLLEQVIN